MSALQGLPGMQVRRARREDLPALRHLIATARYVLHGLADEDLPGLIERGVGVLAEEGRTTWGFLGIEIEPRPPTLPAAAPARGQVRAVALHPGRWPRDHVPELVSAARAMIPAGALPIQIVAYVQEAWLLRALTDAGFDLLDQIIFLRLEHLARYVPPSATPGHCAHLRPGSPADVATLAALDAAAFEPIWHFAANDITEMLIRGRVCVAEVEGRPAGYTAILPNSQQEAQLARIGVAPDLQGLGIGRQLLEEAIDYTRTQGYSSLLLNTQESNTRSQRLYTAAGFKRTRDVIPVLSLTLAHRQRT